MKKVVLFSALVLSVAMLAGCSGKENSSGGTTSKVNSANTGSVIVDEPPVSKVYDEREQVTDDWRFVYDRKLGGIKILDCLCAQKNGGDRIYNSVEDIVVPKTFEGFEDVEVLEIGENALGYITECNSITLPDSIKYIDAHVFAGSTVKQPIVIPPSVEDMSEEAFAYITCEVQLPPTLKKISKRLFYGSKISHITIPSDVEVIEEDAFYQCQYLTDIVFNENLKKIENGAFKNCWTLQTITFNDGLEEIGEEAFSNCYELRSVTFGNSLKKIDKGAFSSCDHLTEQTIYLPDSLNSYEIAFTMGWGNSLPKPLMYKGNLYNNVELEALLNAAE